VMQSDDPLRRGKAAVFLGRLLLEGRDWAGAREALQLAVNAPEPGIAGFALVFLGDALAMLGQPDEAWRAYFRASRSVSPRVSEMADDRLDRRAWQRGRAMSDGGTDRADDGAEPGGADPVAGRLDAVTEALVTRQLTVWRRDVYRDRDGDGTGDVGWLWLRAGQRAFPARDHDVLLQYGADEAEWQASTPDGRTRRIADAGPDALAVAVAAFVTDQPEDPGTAPPGETPEGAVVSGAASRLPPAETLRNLPDWITLILGGVTTAVVIPFAQDLATTTATDVYKKIKDKLSRDKPKSVAAASTGYVQVTDSDADVQLIYPEPIPPRAIEKLIKKLTERDLSELRGCTLVWDTVREDWFLCRLA
jgi:hypothetical protein